MPSAKSLICEEMLLSMSLINTRNRRGPRTEPWGTPDRTGTLVDVLSTTTTWYRMERKFLILSKVHHWYHTRLTCRAGDCAAPCQNWALRALWINKVRHLVKRFAEIHNFLIDLEAMVIVLVEVMHKVHKLGLTGKAWVESMLSYGKDVILLQMSQGDNGKA